MGARLFLDWVFLKRTKGPWKFIQTFKFSDQKETGVPL